MYDYLFQRNFPLYTAFFGTVRLLILGIFHSIRTLFGPVRLLNLGISMSSPLLYTLLRKSLVQTLIQVRNIPIFAAWNKNKQKCSAILNLYTSEWRSRCYWLQGTLLGMFPLYTIIPLYIIIDVWVFFHSMLLFRSILLLTSGYFSTLYYYSALILLLIASDFSTL